MASEPDPVVSAILRWRRRMALDLGASRAASARLRRCASLFDALMERETVELIKAARAAGGVATHEADQRLAVIAIALAHAPGDGPLRFAGALGRTAEGRAPAADERPRLSPARFAALLRAARSSEWDAFARALRRAFAILGDAPFNVAALVDDLVFLNDSRLQRWTYDYWQTTPPQDEPTADSEHSPIEAESLP